MEDTEQSHKGQKVHKRQNAHRSHKGHSQIYQNSSQIHWTPLTGQSGATRWTPR
jgi:hypothetical protein